MNLHEYQAKELLRQFGIPAPPGRAVRSPKEAEEVARNLGGGKFVVKAQIHAGGRGKAGGVVLVEGLKEVRAVSRGLLGKRLKTAQTGPEGQPVDQVLIQIQADITKEFYVAIVLDRSADAVYFLKGSGITRPKDLEGRTMGAAAGETPLNVFPAFAAGAGLDAKKVQWINMTPPSKIPSLMSKKVDSIITFTTEEPAVERAAQKAGVEFGRLLYSDFGVDYYSIGLIARDQLLQEQPDLVRRFVDATIRGYAWAIENPQGAADAFVKHHPETSRDLVLDQWKIVSAHMVTPIAKEKGLGTIDAGKMGRTLDLLKRFYTLERPVAVDDVFTMKFLPRITAKGM